MAEKTEWHGYLLFVNISLDLDKNNRFEATLKGLGTKDDPQPARINHSRLSLDGQKLIVETAFKIKKNDSELAPENFKKLLAPLYGIAWPTIDSVEIPTSYGSQIRLSRSGVDYLDILLFAGEGSTWEESHEQVLRYLHDNLSQWETNET